MTAVAEILGFRLSEEAEELLLNLAGLKDVEDVNYSEFCGIGALAERIGRKGISNRDDLEIVDFNLFNQRLSYININPSLNRLLTFICRWQYNKRRNQTRQFQDQVLYSRGEQLILQIIAILAIQNDSSLWTKSKAAQRMRWLKECNQVGIEQEFEWVGLWMYYIDS